jgi:hypothetical protein
MLLMSDQLKAIGTSGQSRYNALSDRATYWQYHSMAQRSMIHSRAIGCWSILLLLLGALGCQQRTTARLLGEWVGRPDTAAARALRESEKFGDDRPSGTLDTSSETITDWQQVDIGVKVHFVSTTQLEMSLEDGAQPQSGNWHVLEATPVVCTIEVETATGEGESAELRRFQLELDELDGELVGFLLTEVGADRQLGALYFSRPLQAQ